MFQRILAPVVLAVMLLNGSSMSQTTCGDIDGNGSVNVGDITIILSHVMYKNGYDIWPNLDLGDVDGRTGVTIGDAADIARSLFVDQHALDCTPTEPYTLTRLTTDTLWVSVMKDIPDGIDHVTMPLRTSLQANCGAIEISALHMSFFNHDKFRLSAITGTGSPAVMTAYVMFGDTASIVMVEVQPGALTGRREYLTLEFDRVEPGLGDAGVYYFFGQSDDRRVAFERDGDLFEPMFMTTEFSLPPDTLLATVPTLNFATITGIPVPTTSDLVITSAYGNITFSLTPSESWISLPSPPPGGWTTPATIPVGVSVVGLPDGNYSGSISVSVVDPVEAINTVSDIPVTLQIAPPLTIPFGDITCDGKISVADIARLIDLLFVSGAPLANCE